MRGEHHSRPAVRLCVGRGQVCCKWSAIVNGLTEFDSVLLS